MRRYLVALWLLLSLAPASYAEQVSGLYDVTLPVSAQSSQELGRATREGLKTVLVRVSGSSAVLTQRPVIAAIKQASSYTRQYGYEYYRNEEDDSEQMRVLVEFEPKLIDQLLRGAGLPLWSSNRPSVLVWMVVDDIDGRRFVGPERDPSIVKAVRDNAIRRGLSVKFPDLDLQDMVALSVNDLWQLNEHKAGPALERYKADTVLLGRVSKLTNGEWLGRWSYSDALQQYRFDGEGETVEEYVGAAIDEVAEVLASQYAVVPVNTTQDGVLMRVSGVTGFIDYARVISYLESVAAIRHANVVYINGDAIVVRLIADGQLSQLAQSFALGRKLQAVNRGRMVDKYRLDLDYHWPASTANKPQ